MLILSRKLNESIIIDGNIVVKVLRIDKDTVKLGIQAPSELPVHREEIYQAIQKNKQAGINGSPNPNPRNAQGPAAPSQSNPDPAPAPGEPPITK
ncbi:MAG TPA: carbon storage regulator CsrA [Candidatus Saccharimonadales bacterium]|jgi:carbon storage regulator|nr:carbon storage regulator CsrA [Candidatus Saccharimonadales bacterium]